MSERGKKTDLVVPQEVRILLEERSKIQGWLAKLDELQGASTPAVFERVSSDYGSRLDVVSTQLLEHRDALEGSVAKHGASVKELQDACKSVALTLEEAELRFKVGEYSEEEWERHRAEGERSMQEREAELAEEQTALSELEEVLEELISGRGQEPLPAESSGAESSPPGLTDTPVGAVTFEPGESPEADVEKVETTEPVVSVESEPPKEDSREYLDELEFLESLSLDEAERFDAVSLMLDEAGEGKEEKGGEEERSD